MEKRIKQLEKKNREQEHEISRLIDICNRLKVENEHLRHWNKCLAEKRHQDLKGDGDD